MPTLMDAFYGPYDDWPLKGGGGPPGQTPGTGGPGGAYGGGGGFGLPGRLGASFSQPVIGLSQALARRRKLLMGLPGPTPVSPDGTQPVTAAGASRGAATPSFGGFGSALNGRPQAPAPAPAPTGPSQNYSPGDPWAPYLNDPRGSISGLLNRIIGGGGQAGAFDPSGEGIMRFLEQKLGTDQAARQAQAGTAARYYAGEDPAAAGFASLASVLGGQSQNAQEMNAARLDAATRIQDWIRSILGGAPDQAFQLQMARENQPKQGGGSIGIGPVSFGWGG